MASLNKKSKGIGIVVLILAVIAIAYLAKGGNFYTPGLGGISVPNLAQALSGTLISPNTSISGYSTLSLSQVQIASPNIQGFNGKYWLAQIYANGVGQALTGSDSASSFVKGSSNYSGTQQDTLSITVLKNNLIYPIDLSQVVLLQNFTFTPYPKAVPYTDCNNKPQYPLGGTPMLSTCVLGTLGGKGDQATYLSYIGSCLSQTKNGNVTIPVIIGFSPNAANYNLVWKNIAFTSGAEFECYQFNATTLATVYNFQSPSIQETVAGTLNGQTLTVSNAGQGTSVATYNQSGGTVAFQLRLLYPQQGFQIYPTATQIGTVLVYTKKTGNQQTGTPVLIGYISSQTLAQNENKQINALYNLQNGTKINLTYLQNQVSQINYNIAGGLTTVPSNYSQNTYFPQGTTNYSVTLQDTTGQYYRPVLQVISNFQYMGITIASANCSIIKAQGATYNASGVGIVSALVKNTGQFAGGCIPTLQVSNPFYTPNPTLQSQYLLPGSTYNFTWQSYYKQFINKTNQTMGTIISCDAATGTICYSKQVTLTATANCASGAPIINGQGCKPLTSVTTVASTSIPACATAGNCPSVTTIINGGGGGGCPSNQTSVNGVCTGGGGGIPWTYIVIAIIVIGIIIVISSKAGVKGGGNIQGIKRGPGRPPKMDYAVG